MKLTETQIKVLNEIEEDINFAKRFNNFKDYWIAERLKYINKDRFDYQELVEWYESQYDNETEKTYKHYWLDKLNNKTLTMCSSATLRKLEKEGFIEIIKDSANERVGIDKVKLIKSYR